MSTTRRHRATVNDVVRMTRGSAVRGWWMSRRTDPVVYVVGLVALAVYVLHGFSGALSRDLGIYSYAGQQAAEGVPPYVGIMNRVGPLAHLIPGIGVGIARIGGFDDLLGMRLLFLGLSVGCVCLIYLLGRNLFASRLAGLASAAALLTFNGFIEYASNGPREKTSMVFFLLCALLAVVGRRWFGAGVSIALATLVWQPAFVVGILAVGIPMLAVPRGGRLRAVVRVAAGGMVPTLLCLGYFAAVGALREFVDAFLLINAEYAESQPFWIDPGPRWSLLRMSYGPSLWVMFVGLFALVILGPLVLRRKNRHDPARVSVAAVSIAALASVAMTLRDFNGWPDAFVLLPLAALGIGGIAMEISTRVAPRAAIGLVTAWVIAAVAMASHYSIAERDNILDLQRDSVDVVLGRLSSDASMLSIEAPQPLVLARLTNPIRHQVFLGALGLYLDDTWHGGLQGFGRWVGREEPTIIAIGRRGVPSFLRGPIRREYWRVAPAPGWMWYVHRSVGRDVLVDLRTQLSPDAMVWYEE